MSMEHWQRMQRENENLKKQLKALQKERSEMDFLFRYHREMTAALDVTREEQSSDIEAMRRELDRLGPLMLRASAEIQQLRAERDEARRMWCEAAPVGNSLSVNDMDRRARAEATRRGWDCFKEEGKP